MNEDGKTTDAPETSATNEPEVRAARAARARAKERRARLAAAGETPAAERRSKGNADVEEPQGVRTTFAADYPKDAALERLLTAFDRGDFGTVRRGTAELLRTTQDATVRHAALDLRQRTSASPVAVLLLIIGFALMAILFAHYLASPP